MRPLLTRLRDVDIYAEDFEEVMAEAADRIEELEKALRLISEMGMMSGNHAAIIAKGVLKETTPAS